MAMAHRGVFRHGQKNSRTLFIFTIVFKFLKKMTYISTSGKAVFPRYLMQGRASFKFIFHFQQAQIMQIIFLGFEQMHPHYLWLKQFLFISSVVSSCLDHCHDFCKNTNSEKIAVTSTQSVHGFAQIIFYVPLQF